MMMPFALTRRGWGFAFAAAGLWVISWVVGLGDLRYLVALLLAMVLIAVASALALAALARFDLRISLSDPAPTVGDESRLILAVRHRLPMTIPVRVVWETATKPADPKAAQMTLEVSPARGAVARTNLVAHHRGPQKVGVAALFVPDPLGLVARRLRHDASAEMLVLPRLLEALPDELNSTAYGAGAGATFRGRSADSGGPIGAVREYRTGDAMRQVHWKQSARQGELLVKLHDTSDTAQRSILLVTDADAYPTGAEFETAVSATAAVAARWLSNGLPVQLHLGDTHPHLCTTRGEMLRHLASVHVTREPAMSAGRLVEQSMPAAGDRRGSVDVVVAGTVTSRLVRRMESTQFTGTLITTRPTAGNAGSAGWRVATISSLLPADGATSAVIQNSAPVDTQRRVKVADHG